MLELRLDSVRLKGCAFTLKPTAQKCRVDFELIKSLLHCMHNHLGMHDEVEGKHEEIIADNPFLPSSLRLEDVTAKGDSDVRSYYSVQDYLNADLLTQDGEELLLTEKAIKVLTKAAELQITLASSGFNTNPCARKHPAGC
ncbi:MAG: hypothetical protein FWC79_00930 [Oscillospiraceae bacterium]|nr:hypothetical protein [Oscillospiraceae bacterium]